MYQIQDFPGQQKALKMCLIILLGRGGEANSKATLTSKKLQQDTAKCFAKALLHHVASTKLWWCSLTVTFLRVSSAFCAENMDTLLLIKAQFLTSMAIVIGDTWTLLSQQNRDLGLTIKVCRCCEHTWSHTDRVLKRWRLVENLSLKFPQILRPKSSFHLRELRCSWS